MKDICLNVDNMNYKNRLITRIPQRYIFLKWYLMVWLKAKHVESLMRIDFYAILKFCKIISLIVTQKKVAQNIYLALFSLAKSN